MMACPNGDLCPILQGHIEGLSSIADSLHLDKYAHFCSYRYTDCPFVGIRDRAKNHHFVRHPCTMGSSCPFLQDEVDMESFNNHIKLFYHQCPMMEECPLINDRYHKGSYSHKEIKVKSKNNYTCGTCYRCVRFCRRLFCNHYMCDQCQKDRFQCEPCLQILQNIDREPRVNPSDEISSILDVISNVERKDRTSYDERLDVMLSETEEKEDRECVICKESLDNGEDREMLLCTHLYHEKCLSEWFRISGRERCPLCNVELDTLLERQRSLERSIGISDEIEC